MADKPTMTIGPKTAQEIVKLTKFSPGFFTVFSNHSRIAVSQTDFRFFVGETYPTAQGELEVIEHLCVTMTPLQAKTVLASLAQAVSTYESNFGQIPQLIVQAPNPPSQ